MSSSQREPDDSVRRLAEDQEASESTAREELQHVLEETMTRDAFDQSLQPEERAALVAVARQYRQLTPELETVVPQLVSAMLHIRLRHLQASPETWQTMCGQIAESLLDAPHARERIRALWTRLCECAR
jgi:hypothetical protein